MREMRRKDRELSPELALRILKDNNHGVLSLVLPDGTPYGVPLNYGFDQSKIIMHAALVGLKMDAIANHPRGCFTVIHKAEVDSANLQTFYASALAFGPLEVITDPVEKRAYLIKLLAHYHISETDAQKALEVDTPYTSVIVLSIEQLTGKGYANLFENQPAK